MRRMTKYTRILLKTKKDEKLYCAISGHYRKFEKPKILYLLEKVPAFLLFAGRARIKINNYLKKKDQLKY